MFNGFECDIKLKQDNRVIKTILNMIVLPNKGDIITIDSKNYRVCYNHYITTEGSCANPEVYNQLSDIEIIVELDE